jgi:hypothetical protein
LTESEVKEIAEELANESKPESAEAIQHAIETVTSHKPQDSDVARVKARLAAGGWPGPNESLTQPSSASRRSTPGGGVCRAVPAAATSWLGRRPGPA